jgi:hypothetical protein
MHFRLEYTVRKLLMHGPSAQWTCPGRVPVQVTLREPTEEEQKSGHPSDDAFCTAVLEQEPPPTVRAMFEALSKNRLPPGTEPDTHYPSYFHKSPPYLNDDGTIRENHNIPMGILPMAFKRFASEIHATLFGATRRVVRIVRWRLNLGVPHNPYSSRGTFWSLDGVNWRWMPSGGTVKGGATALPRFSDAQIQAVATLLGKGVDEPFAYDLYREAWSQRDSNPRSALVVAVSAAEVGVKEFIKERLTDRNADWLLDAIQTPPLERMIPEYLPRLIVGQKPPGFTQPIPDAVYKGVIEAVRKRNTVVHRKSSGIRHDELTRMLLAIGDLLWLLDYYSGHDWALAYVRREVLSGGPGASG